MSEVWMTMEEIEALWPNRKPKPLEEPYKQLAMNLRDKALAQVEQNADQDWLAQAWIVLRSYCREHPGLVFTSPGFVLNSHYRYDLPHPREARVWGAIFRQAAKEGLIEKTGQYMQSPDPRQHLRPVACWRVIGG